jgi:hypothetical protein
MAHVLPAADGASPLGMPTWSSDAAPAALGDAEEGFSLFGTVTYMANARGVRSLRLKEAS